MAEESAQKTTTTERKWLQTALKAVAVFGALALLLYVLYSTYVSAAPAGHEGEFMVWLKSPVGEMKVWHLIAIIYFVNIFTKD